MTILPSKADRPVRFQYALLGLLIVAGVIDAFFPAGRKAFFYLAISFLIVLLSPPIMRMFGARLSSPTYIAFWLFVTVACYLSNRYGLYKKFWFYDVILHFSSGFILSLIWYDFLFRERAWEDSAPLTVKIFIALSASVASAGVWEIGEFLSDILTKMDFQRNNLPEREIFHSSWQNPGILDTMNDMINGTVGALLSVIPLSFPTWKKHEKTA
jgi:hypothetical protein